MLRKGERISFRPTVFSLPNVNNVVDFAALPLRPIFVPLFQKKTIYF
jgi:hypothetical protein